MANLDITVGSFKNGIAYTRFGSGERKLVIFPGGPGNEMPSGFMLRMMVGSYKFFAHDYIIYLMTRRRNMPSGYTTRDMSEDYAVVIRDEMDGPVDIIGTSYGGLIAQHFAADHPDLVRRLILALTAYQVSDAGKELDTQVSKLQSQGKWGKAYATEISGMFRGVFKKYVFMFLMRLMFLTRRKAPTYPTDPLVEAEAEANHNTRGRLFEINVPTIVIGGDDDFFFPVEFLQETAAGIPNAKLVLYEGLGHNAGFDKRLNRDILAFLRE